MMNGMELYYNVFNNINNIENNGKYGNRYFNNIFRSRILNLYESSIQLQHPIFLIWKKWV